MLCIAAFIVFAILGVFSATHRRTAVKAWKCVLNRVTFRPCDINLGKEVKGKLVAKMVFAFPGGEKMFGVVIDIVAFLFVILSIWSVWAVANSSLNLWIYDTCDPVAQEGCSLAGDSCTVGLESLSLVDAVRDGQILAYVAQPFTQFGETLSRIPDRLKAWDPTAFTGSGSTYKESYDASKPTVLEIIDPLCQYCRDLYRRGDRAGLSSRVNLTYILYPIPSHEKKGEYRFKHSYEIAQYVEFIKRYKNKDGISMDWLFLRELFTGKDEKGIEYQEAFKSIYTDDDIFGAIHHILKKIGFTEDDLEVIYAQYNSPEIVSELMRQRSVVEGQIRTIKIPTVLAPGRRYDRLPSEEQLRHIP